MNRTKKPSTVAQSPTEIRSEAAIKVFPKNGKIKPVEDDATDTDGEDPDSTDVTQFVIDVALNGYVLTVTLDDGTEEKTVHTDFNEVLTAIRSRH